MNKNRWVYFVGILLLSFSHICVAKDFSKLYTTEQLIRVQNVYGKNIYGVLFSDIPPYLTVAERITLSTVHLKIPLYTEDRSLFHFSMNNDTGVMTIPALSIKFFDDLAIAFAWYDRFKLDSENIRMYFQRLYTENDFFEPPLRYLNVPDKAWEQDAFVDDVSQKTLKSGIAFLLLHELGHWQHKHSRYSEISNSRAQNQEKQADAFALDIMKRMSTPPYGMVLWFMVTGLLGGDQAITHPLSSDRLNSIAFILEQNPGAFISLDNKKNLDKNDIKKVALEIRNIAAQLR